MNRRDLLRSMLFAGIAPAIPGSVFAASGTVESLRAEPTRVNLLGAENPDTLVWAYNGTVPGPSLRVKRGATLRAELVNGLPEASTIHWHGLRVPNHMDGVPDLSQPAVPPGARFRYEFPCEDPGTYWFHPHYNTLEQLARGLYGTLIVAENEAPEVDRELTLVLDDWRLNAEGQISSPMHNRHDFSHAGRLGDIPTVNGHNQAQLPVRSGERLRLRLLNAANARIYQVRLEGLQGLLVALDGQALADPRPMPDPWLTLGPGNRADLIVDCDGAPGDRVALRARTRRGSIPMAWFAHTEESRLADRGLGIPPPLEAPLREEPRPADAQRLLVELGGGAMDPKLRRGQTDMDTVRQRVAAGAFWTVNGRGRLDLLAEPDLKLSGGESAIITLRNDTAFQHPMHLHGHHFRVVSRNGSPTANPPWLDTVVVNPGEELELAFVAGRPGRWLFHCHVPSHMRTGMAAVVAVA